MIAFLIDVAPSGRGSELLVIIAVVVVIAVVTVVALATGVFIFVRLRRSQVETDGAQRRDYY
jgi:flagellar basal body-associated protein FliL